MERVRAFIKTGRGRICFVLALHMCVLLCSVVVMPPLYETNDDVSIRQFINGSRPVRDPHLIHQNIVLGIVYKVFYHITVQVPWYDLIQYLVVFLAFSAAAYVLLDRLGGRRAMMAIVLIQIFFAVDCYARPQFTKTAGVATAAGMLLLFWAMEKQRTVWWEVLAGIVLTCVGFMYRQMEGAACILLMSPLGVYFLLGLSAETKEAIDRTLRKGLCIFGVLAVLLSALSVVDHLAYEKDPMWSDYKRFNGLRTELLDYGFPDYETNRDVYDSLDINKDAFQLYSSWNFNDPDKFNIQAMEKIVSLKPEKRFTIDTVKSFVGEMPGILKNTYTFRCACILLILWMIWGEHSKRAVVSLLCMCGIFLLSYIYLFYKGRYGMNRVDVGFWFSISLVLAYLLRTGRAVKRQRAAVALTVSLCIFALWAGQKNCRPFLWIHQQAKTEQRAALREVIEALGMDKEHLYLVKARCIPEYDCYGTFDAMPGEILGNMCWLGGWDCNTSGQLEVLERFGVEDPYRDLVDREDVFLVDDDIGLTVRYIREYYDPDAKAEFIKTVGNIKLYQIVSGASADRT